MDAAICQELFKGLITLVVGLAVAYVGLWLYFRQKEYELVKQRHLEQCIDVIASELELALGTFSHNWARCLQILKDYRDMEVHFDIKQLSAGFLELHSSRFQRIAHFRLRSHAVRCAVEGLPACSRIRHKCKRHRDNRSS